MAADLEAVRQTYLQQQPIYEDLATHVADALRRDTRERGILCEVDSRSKGVASLVKKAIRKRYLDPLKQIRDKAGVRVVVRYPDALGSIDALIQERFEVKHHEDKRAKTNFTELAYRGTHYEVVLRSRPPGRADLENLICEIQVHTRAEHLWSDVSHDLLYKPAQVPPGEIQRRVYRLVALVELFDSEVRLARDFILGQPGYEAAAMLFELEQAFFKLSARQFDSDLSLTALDSLRSTYTDAERARFASLIAAFVDANRTRLDGLYSTYALDDDAPVFMFQPESLIVLERLAKHRYKLRSAWAAVLPAEMLQELEDVWGESI